MNTEQGTQNDECSIVSPLLWRRARGEVNEAEGNLNTEQKNSV